MSLMAMANESSLFKFSVWLNEAVPQPRGWPSIIGDLFIVFAQIIFVEASIQAEGGGLPISLCFAAQSLPFHLSLLWSCAMIASFEHSIWAVRACREHMLAGAPIRNEVAFRLVTAAHWATALVHGVFALISALFPRCCFLLHQTGVVTSCVAMTMAIVIVDRRIFPSLAVLPHMVWIGGLTVALQNYFHESSEGIFFIAESIGVTAGVIHHAWVHVSLRRPGYSNVALFQILPLAIILNFGKLFLVRNFCPKPKYLDLDLDYNISPFMVAKLAPEESLMAVINDRAGQDPLSAEGASGYILAPLALLWALLLSLAAGLHMFAPGEVKGDSTMGNRRHSWNYRKLFTK